MSLPVMRSLPFTSCGTHPICMTNDEKCLKFKSAVASCFSAIASFSAFELLSRHQPRPIATTSASQNKSRRLIFGIFIPPTLT